MYDWITEHKIPLGQWMKALIDFLIANASGFFDFVSLVLGTLIEGLTNLLLMLPPLTAVGLAAAGTFLVHRRIGLMLFVVLSLLFIANLGYWEAMIQTLSLVLCATIVCVIIGVPVGI